MRAETSGTSDIKSDTRQINAWTEFVPFLDYSPEIRRVIYSTNAIESLNARFRRATRARGHFPNEQAAIKCLYLLSSGRSTRPAKALPGG